MTLNSKNKDLTDLDIDILKKLSDDDRISHRQLGRDLNKRSPVTIKKHVEELEKIGIIKNYNINLDYEKLGYDIIAIIEVTISKGKMFDVEKQIAQNPNVFGVYDITGTYDALILARFRTKEDLSNMIKEELHTSPNVEHTNTHIVLNIIKEGSSFTDLIEQEKAREVEEKLVDHPAILEAGVVFIPDPNIGEIIKAYVVKHPEHKDKITEREIIEWSKEELTGIKYLHQVEFINVLPRTAVGKIFRRKLQEKAIENLMLK